MHTKYNLIIGNTSASLSFFTKYNTIAEMHITRVNTQYFSQHENVIGIVINESWVITHKGTQCVKSRTK